MCKQLFILFFSANACKDKWARLRTQKRSIYNDTKKIKSGSGREPAIKWRFYKNLSFLEPYFNTGM